MINSHETEPQADSLIRLSRFRAVWQTYQQTNPETGPGLGFDPSDREETFWTNPFGFINFKVVFHLIEQKGGGMIIPVTLHSLPITLQETLNVLSNSKIGLDNFFDRFPDNYHFYKDELPIIEQRLAGTSEDPEADLHDHDLYLKWQERYSKGLTDLAPFKRKADYFVQLPITEDERSAVTDLILQDQRDVIEATLTIMETGKDPFLPEQYHPNRVTLLSRLKLLAPHADDTQENRIASATLSVVKEQVDFAQIKLADGRGDVAMNILDPIIDDARPLQIDLSSFSEAAREAVLKKVGYLQDKLKRAEEEANVDFFTRLQRKAIYNTLMRAALGEVTDESEDVQRLTRQIFNTAWVAGYSEDEEANLQQSVQDLTTKLALVKKPPIWQRWIENRLFRQR